MAVPLPIDEHLPRLVAASASGALVLVAEPGAGKTTRLPPALLEGDRNVVVLEPRRVAAKLAASRVADELGVDLGGRVGYQVRFDSKVSRATRLRFVTEGILARQLVHDPELRGVDTVVLDEFHERSLHTDLALALLQRLRTTRRPDLRIVVMSATLDPDPVAHLLRAEVARIPGRVYPVELEYVPAPRKPLPLERRVAGALGRLFEGGHEGDVLVFLPGVGDIQRAIDACREVERRHDLLTLPLHGGLSLSEQTRALRPADRQRVILSTNLAESSLTVEGVTAVIDSGLARQSDVLPGSGLPALVTRPISRASADQRAGRAGRLEPGRCVRLYGEADYHGRPEEDTPEILREDLSGLLLDLRASELGTVEELPWLEPPPAGAITAARGLLDRLHATTPDRARALARFPLPLRLARFVQAAAERGMGRAACEIAATLSEDVRGAPRIAEDIVEGYLAGALQQGGRTRQARDQLRRLLPGGSERAPTAEALRRALLAGAPDRVAGVRKGGQLQLASGGAARLVDAHVARPGDTILVLGARASGRPGRPSETQVTTFTTVERDWILEEHEDGVTIESEYRWNDQAQRVEAVEAMKFGSLVLEESVDVRPTGPAVARLLVERATAKLDAVLDPSRVTAFLDRLQRLCDVEPELPRPADDELEQALGDAAVGCSSLRDLAQQDLVAHLEARLDARSPGASRRLRAAFPAEVALASGRRLRVQYEPGKDPYVASFLQDFFGSKTGPTIGGGRIPLVLHLLAPNRRPVQITTDLAGFWERHYPSIRKELRQRYTRHDWPEDPTTATPPERGRGRRRRR